MTFIAYQSLGILGYALGEIKAVFAFFQGSCINYPIDLMFHGLFECHTPRRTFQFYNHSMDHSAVQKLTLENDLRHALARNETRFAYAPVMWETDPDWLAQAAVSADALFVPVWGSRCLVGGDPPHELGHRLVEDRVGEVRRLGAELVERRRAVVRPYRDEALRALASDAPSLEATTARDEVCAARPAVSVTRAAAVASPRRAAARLSAGTEWYREVFMDSF